MRKLLCYKCFCSKCFDPQHHMTFFCNGVILGVLTGMVGVQQNYILIPQKKVDVSYRYFLTQCQYYLDFCSDTVG